MAVIVNDTFTEAADTALTAHTPDTGSGWTKEEAAGTTNVMNVSGANDNAVASGATNSARLVYSAQPNPSVVEYDIEVTLPGIATGAGGGDDVAALLARFADTSNYYTAGTYGATSAADKKIKKTVAGVVTELATGDNGLTAGDTLKFQVRDAAKKLFHNGVEILSTADNALTAAGKAGFALGNVWVATDDLVITYTLDNFSVTEVAAAASRFRRTLGARAGSRSQ